MGEEEQKNPVDFGTYISFLKEAQTYLSDAGFDKTVLSVDYQPHGYDEAFDEDEFTNPEDIKEEIMVRHTPDTINLNQDNNVLFGLNVIGNRLYTFAPLTGQKKAIKEIAKKYNIKVK